MTAANFARSLALVLAAEGGFVDDKHDPGGATNKGVTQRVYDGWRRLHARPHRSVRYVTLDETAAIYRRQYWDAVEADRLSAGVDYCVFDEAVNSGPRRAIRDLQAALGNVEIDGWFGVETLAAVAAFNDRAALVHCLCDRRLGFLRHLVTWRWFGRGWTRRVANVRANALAMIEGEQTA